MYSIGLMNVCIVYTGCMGGFVQNTLIAMRPEIDPIAPRAPSSTHNHPKRSFGHIFVGLLCDAMGSEFDPNQYVQDIWVGIMCIHTYIHTYIHVYSTYIHT